MANAVATWTEEDEQFVKKQANIGLNVYISNNVKRIMEGTLPKSDDERVAFHAEALQDPLSEFHVAVAANHYDEELVEKYVSYLKSETNKWNNKMLGVRYDKDNIAEVKAVTLGEMKGSLELLSCSNKLIGKEKMKFERGRFKEGGRKGLVLKGITGEEQHKQMEIEIDEFFDHAIKIDAQRRWWWQNFWDNICWWFGNALQWVKEKFKSGELATFVAVAKSTI